MKRTGMSMTNDKEVRLSGRVSGIHPPVREGDKPVRGGYIWIQGENGVAYFGHVTQILGKSIDDLQIGQACTFDAQEMEKGPAALLIEF